MDLTHVVVTSACGGRFRTMNQMMIYEGRLQAPSFMVPILEVGSVVPNKYIMQLVSQVMFIGGGASQR